MSCKTQSVIIANCPFDIHEVVKQAGWKNVRPIQAVRWRQQKDERPLVVDGVVILGKRDNKFVLMSAYRHPVGGHNIWNRTEISVMYDWGDKWIIGEKEYSSLPTSKELTDFLEETWWDNGKDRFETVFEGKKEIEKPTN